MIPRLICTAFGLGYLRPASGTIASMVAVAIGVAVYQAGAGWAIPVLAMLATVLGFWAVPQMIAGQPDKDPSEVVIDEFAGQWIALSFTAIPLLSRDVSMLAAWPAYVAPFLLFRLFDIWKPWVIGRADRRGDAVGVMLDDILAGLAAGIVAVMLAGVYHGVIAR